MGLCISTTSHRQSTGRIALSGKFQWLRYALFYLLYLLASERGRHVCNSRLTTSTQIPDDDFLHNSRLTSLIQFFDDDSLRNSRRTASIQILDDDSLLHVFYLCRPFFRDEDRLADWRYSEIWWYALAHVCRRWRNIILGSATHLGLSLLCTYGTPVADMLAHSPPFPILIGYFSKDHELTAEEEEGIILALKQHDRVRRVRLGSAGTIMQKLIVIMNEEYPILESLYIMLPIEDNMILTFPGTFQAPQLRELTLQGFALPIGSRLLTTAVGLITLYLVMVHPSAYFHPNTLLQWISHMPHLETLKIRFEFSTPNRDVERQLTHSPIIAHITLPNLHCFHFQGVSTYLEALVHRITTPRLKELNINFFNQLTFSVPRLLQFIDTAEDFRFSNAVLTFSAKGVDAMVSHEESEVYTLSMVIKCCHLDWQASSMAQISNSLGQMFSTVEYLVLQHNESSVEHNEVDRTEWHKLLRPFSNVKTLWVGKGLFKDISRCLELDDGELAFELLPELRVLGCFGSSNIGGAFTSFIDTRCNAGRPITLVHRLLEPTLSGIIL